MIYDSRTIKLTMLSVKVVVAKAYEAIWNDVDVGNVTTRTMAWQPCDVTVTM